MVLGHSSNLFADRFTRSKRNRSYLGCHLGSFGSHRIVVVVVVGAAAHCNLLLSHRSSRRLHHHLTLSLRFKLNWIGHHDGRGLHGRRLLNDRDGLQLRRILLRWM